MTRVEAFFPSIFIETIVIPVNYNFKEHLLILDIKQWNYNLILFFHFGQYLIFSLISGIIFLFLLFLALSVDRCGILLLCRVHISIIPKRFQATPHKNKISFIIIYSQHNNINIISTDKRTGSLHPMQW